MVKPEEIPIILAFCTGTGSCNSNSSGMSFENSANRQHAGRNVAAAFLSKLAPISSQSLLTRIRAMEHRTSTFESDCVSGRVMRSGLCGDDSHAHIDGLGRVGQHTGGNIVRSRLRVRANV